MKCLLLLLVFSGLLAAPVLALQDIYDTFPDTDYQTLAKAGLHGPMKMVRFYDAKGGRLLEARTFDDHGRLVKEMNYHPGTGELLWTHLYTYNQAGLLVTATSSGHFVQETGASCTYVYDEKGNLLTLTGYDSAGKPLWMRSYTYDEQGHKLTENLATWDSEQQRLRVYHQEWHRYNAHGDEIEWRCGGPKEQEAKTVTKTYQYAPDGTILRREENWSDGQKILKVYSAQGELLEDLYIPLVVPGKYCTGEYHHERYTYAAGHLTQCTGYNEQDQLKSRWEYDYNTAGQKIEERSYGSRPGQQELPLCGKRQYRYDEKGRMIEETVYTDWPHGPTAYHWSYDAYGNMYDANGNMVGLPNTDPSPPNEATYREFTYFTQ